MAKLNRAGRKHKRNEGTKETQPGNYLIVTEGTETEVNYFKNIKQIIEGLYSSSSVMVEKIGKIELDIQGTARSTKVLVNEAINFAKKERLNVVWLNERFELWLLLHFQDLKSAIGRDNYTDKLNTHFKKNNLNNGMYNKNIYNIFDITRENAIKAIKRSKELLEDHEDKKNFTPDKMNPGTTVQDLVEELIKYTSINT